MESLREWLRETASGPGRRGLWAVTFGAGYLGALGLAYFLWSGTGLVPASPAPRGSPQETASWLVWRPRAVWPALEDPSPWEARHRALLKAAHRPPLTLATPVPYGPLARVVGMELGDFQVVPQGPAPESHLKRGRVRLSWTPVPLHGVSYVVEVSSHPRLLNAIPRLSRRPTLDLELRRRGEYYWRVRARLGAREIQSPSHRFRLR